MQRGQMPGSSCLLGQGDSNSLTQVFQSNVATTAVATTKQSIAGLTFGVVPLFQSLFGLFAGHVLRPASLVSLLCAFTPLLRRQLAPPSFRAVTGELLQLTSDPKSQRFNGWRISLPQFFRVMRHALRQKLCRRQAKLLRIGGKFLIERFRQIEPGCRDRHLGRFRSASVFRHTVVLSFHTRNRSFSQLLLLSPICCTDK